MPTRKNSNGAGSIYKDRTSGRWVGAITIEVTADGKPRRRKVTGRTQDEVRDRLEQLRRSVELGPGLPAEMTTARFLNYWIADVLPLADIAQTTIDGYERITRLYVLPAVGNVRLDQLAPVHVRKMLTALREQGLSPNTQRLARSVLRRALRTAEAEGYVTRNAAALVDGVKLGGSKGRTLTPEDARMLLRFVHGTEWEALVTVLLSLGLRKGETLGLSWNDIDLDSTPPTLTVRRSLKKRQNGEAYVDEPKTSGSRRTLHLPSSVVESLRRHRVAQAEQRLAFGPDWGGRFGKLDLVFTTPIGTPLDPDRVNREMKQLTATAGLGPWTPHELRHSAASILLAQNVPLKTISEMLGHSSIRVTADVYGHLLEPARTEAADAMETALWG